MTRYATVWLMTFLLCGLGCKNGDGPSPEGSGSGLTTGLEGTILLGPTQPVCQVDVSCDEPFVGPFDLRQGTLIAASFITDDTGHFSVAADPGAYTLAPSPSADAPLPARQGQEVTVGPTGMTHVELVFDTGIR
jgi:hypothetical protein